MTKVEGVENTFKDADGLIYTFNETTNELVLSKDSKIVKIENFEQEAFGISFDNYGEDLADSDISDLITDDTTTDDTTTDDTTTDDTTTDDTTTDDTTTDDTTTDDTSTDDSIDSVLPKNRIILSGSMDNDVIFAKADIKKLYIYGDEGNDLIYGNEEANRIEGEYGSDILYGEGGNDSLIGGSDGSSDVFVGGKGNDKLVGGDGNDTYIFEKGDGKDRIVDSKGVNRIKIGEDVLFGTLVRTHKILDFKNFAPGGEFYRLFRNRETDNNYLINVNQGVLTVYYGDKENPDSVSSAGFQNGKFGFLNLRYILNTAQVAMQQIGASFEIARKEGLNGYAKFIIAVAQNVIDDGINLGCPLLSSYLSIAKYSPYYAAMGAMAANGMDPLVLDLDNDGIETTKLSEGAYFDLDNTTFAEKAGWIKGDDGILVLDKNRDNQITSGDELFGDHTRKKDGTIAKTGYEALADYDDNKDGVIDSKDAIYGEMRVWQDKNSDGISQAGELSTLEQAGVKSVNLANTDINEVDAQGNTLARSGSFEKMNGTQGIAGEYLLARDPIDRRALEQQVSDEIKGLLDVQGTGNMDLLQQAMEKDF